MTEQEARISIDKLVDLFEYPMDNGALKVIHKALEELEQYRALGTVEELKEAREKQVAVKHHHTRVDNIIDKVRKSVCPKCLGLIYTHQEEYPNYCTNCGQRIDWSEEDD